MQKYNLLSVIRQKRYQKYWKSLHKYSNLLNRNFHVDKPNQKWATDISYIRTGQGACIYPSSVTFLTTASLPIRQERNRTIDLC